MSHIRHRRGRSHDGYLLRELLDAEPQLTNDGRLTSLYYARVTDNQDPDKQGRIKVRYHWLEQEGGPVMESDWIARNVAWAGPTRMERNRVFCSNPPLPEVGSLAVVAFIAGNIHDAIFLGQPNYHEDDTGAPPSLKDKTHDWSMRYGLQNGFEFAVDTEGNCYLEVPGNLRIRTRGSTHISSKGNLTLIATKLRLLSLSVLRILAPTLDESNYPRDEEAAELREMMIDAMKGPPGRKDPGIGKIEDIVDGD